MGLSLSRPLLFRSTGSRCAGSVIVAHGPSCSVACGIFPDQGSNQCLLHWQADSTTAPPGKPAPGTFNQSVGKKKEPTSKSGLSFLKMYSLVETLQVVSENCFYSNILDTLKNILRLDGNCFVCFLFLRWKLFNEKKIFGFNV